MTIFGNFSEVWNDNVLELKILMLNFENPQKVGQNNKDPPPLFPVTLGILE